MSVGKEQELAEARKGKTEEMTKMNGDAEWPEGIITLDDGNLEESAGRYPLMLLDCWADWCGYCHKLTPVLEELSRAMRGRVAFAKMDMDQNRRTAMNYGIRGLPTMLLFKEGQHVDTLVGYMPRELIEQRLRSHLM